MRNYLEAKSYPETDNCDVYLKTVPEEIALQTDAGSLSNMTASLSSTTSGSQIAASGSPNVPVASISLLGMGTVWILGAIVQF